MAYKMKKLFSDYELVCYEKYIHRRLRYVQRLPFASEIPALRAHGMRIVSNVDREQVDVEHVVPMSTSIS